MKKIYLVTISLLLLSGCSVQYQLDIDKSLNLNEEVTIFTSSNTESQQIKDYDEYLPIDIDADDFSIFEKKQKGINYYDIKKSNDDKEIKFSYNYNVDQFNNNIIARSCYKYITAMNKEKEQELILSTSKEFLCFDKYNTLEEVTLTITSKYKLIETNADEIDGHNYNWYINRENANNKYLYLSLDTSKRDLTLLEKIQEGEYTNIFTVSVLLFIIGLIIYYILKRKGERRDKI